MNYHELKYALSWIKSIEKIDERIEKKQALKELAINYAGVHKPGGVQPGNKGFWPNR